MPTSANFQRKSKKRSYSHYETRIKPIMLVLFLINRDKKELLVSLRQKIYLEVLFYKTSC